MRRTLESLQDEAIRSHEILDFKSGESFYFLKAKATLIDDSELHIKEYTSLTAISIHITGKIRADLLRIRWDNAPHHRDICTFPHHKHLPNLEESKEMSLDGVLKEIKEWLQRPK